MLIAYAPGTTFGHWQQIDWLCAALCVRVSVFARCVCGAGRLCSSVGAARLPVASRHSQKLAATGDSAKLASRNSPLHDGGAVSPIGLFYVNSPATCAGKLNVAGAAVVDAAPNKCLPKIRAKDLIGEGIYLPPSAPAPPTDLPLSF